MRTAILCAAIVGAIGCHDHGAECGGRAPDEFTGCGTDENWCTFEDNEKRATVSDEQAPKLTTPSLTMPLMASPAPRFTWMRTATDVGASAGDVPYMNGPDCNNCCPQFNAGQIGTLHFPPISGNAYDLQFTVDGKVAYRVVTTLQAWVPPASVWSSWRGKSVSLRIYRMTVLRNDPREGPFTATAPVTFQVAP
jgi:hypothetical protein